MENFVEEQMEKRLLRNWDCYFEREKKRNDF